MDQTYFNAFKELLSKVNSEYALMIALPILVFSVILHEIAHGWVAMKLGDPTAYLAGRLTFDPRPHIDLFYTILMPLGLWIITNGSFILGGAKPVPVNPYMLRNMERDYVLVSIAGPLSNILLIAVAMPLIFASFYFKHNWFLADYFLYQIIIINLLLALFNLLPIPPLDGSKILRFFLPRQLQNLMDSAGQFSFLLLIIFVSTNLHLVIMLPIIRFFMGFLNTGLIFFSSIG